MASDSSGRACTGKSVSIFVPARQVHSQKQLHEASPEEVKIPKALLLAVVSQGCCPVQLSFMLHRALDGAGAVDFHEMPMSGSLGVLDRRCLGEIAEFLPLPDRLAFRSGGQKTLQVAVPLNSDGADVWRLALQFTRGKMREKAKRDLQKFKDEVVAETHGFRERLVEETEGFRQRLRTETANLDVRIAAVEARTENMVNKVTKLENQVSRDEETLATTVKLICQFKRRIKELEQQDAQMIIWQQQELIADLQQKLCEEQKKQFAARASL